MSPLLLQPLPKTSRTVPGLTNWPVDVRHSRRPQDPANSDASEVPAVKYLNVTPMCWCVLWRILRGGETNINSERSPDVPLIIRYCISRGYCWSKERRQLFCNYHISEDWSKSGLWRRVSLAVAGKPENQRSQRQQEEKVPLCFLHRQTRSPHHNAVFPSQCPVWGPGRWPEWVPRLPSSRGDRLILASKSESNCPPSCRMEGARLFLEEVE